MMIKKINENFQIIAKDVITGDNQIYFAIRDQDDYGPDSEHWVIVPMSYADLANTENYLAFMFGGKPKL